MNGPFFTNPLSHSHNLPGHKNGGGHQGKAGLNFQEIWFERRWLGTAAHVGQEWFMPHAGLDLFIVKCKKISTHLVWWYEWNTTSRIQGIALPVTIMGCTSHKVAKVAWHFLSSWGASGMPTSCTQQFSIVDRGQ